MNRFMNLMNLYEAKKEVVGPLGKIGTIFFKKGVLHPVFHFIKLHLLH